MCSRNPHHNGSVQFSHSVVFYSLQPDGLQHCQVSLSITNCQSFLKFTSIESVMPSNHLILCRPLILHLQSFPASGLFQWVRSLHQVTKVCSFSLSISPSKEYSGLISFRIDWLDLFAVQGTLKSLLQHCSSKTSILRCSAFFMVQLLHPYKTTGKTTALTRWIFVGEVMSLYFNVLSSTLAWKIPWTEEPGRLQSMGSLRFGHYWATSLSLFTFMHWRRKWQPTPVFLPGESQGWGSLVGCRPLGRTESDMTEAT